MALLILKHYEISFYIRFQVILLSYYISLFLTFAEFYVIIYSINDSEVFIMFDIARKHNLQKELNVLRLQILCLDMDFFKNVRANIDLSEHYSNKEEILDLYNRFSTIEKELNSLVIDEG